MIPWNLLTSVVQVTGKGLYQGNKNLKIKYIGLLKICFDPSCIDVHEHLYNTTVKKIISLHVIYASSVPLTLDTHTTKTKKTIEEMVAVI